MPKHYTTHADFVEYQKLVADSFEKIDRLIFGNGREGLIVEVDRNKKFRIDMEDYLKSMTKKILGMLIVLIFILLGGFTFLAFSLGAL